MLRTTETLLEKGFKDQLIKNWAFASIFGGTPAKRDALIHKALKAGELLQLCRGAYILNTKYRSKTVSQFSIANQLEPKSFVSFETALSFHNWIPEKVIPIMSAISKGRTKNITSPLGKFEYIKVPVREYTFLNSVSRKELNGQPFLIASPLRALADYVYIRKIKWTALNFLLEGMRIEMDNLELLTPNDFDKIMLIYTSKRVLSFLKHLRNSLGK